MSSNFVPENRDELCPVTTASLPGHGRKRHGRRFRRFRPSLLANAGVRQADWDDIGAFSRICGTQASAALDDVAGELRWPDK